MRDFFRYADENTLFAIILCSILTVVIGLMPFMGFYDVSPRQGTQVLEAQGFTQVEIGEHAWFACGGDDWSSSYFSAVNSQGAPVHGVVCCGVFKSCTVRW